MRPKFYCILLLMMFYTGAFAQNVDLPPGQFRNLLIARYPGCFVNVGGNLLLNTTCNAITTEDSLEFHGFIDDNFLEPVVLTGLEYFTSLVYLDCSNNQINTFVSFPASLRYLNCSNSLSQQPNGSLPTFNQGLLHLNCSNNLADEINFPNSLTYIDCSNNWLYSLPALPLGLDTLICRNQNNDPVTHVLQSLPSLPATLRYLDCSRNGLTSLPALPASLKFLDCSANDRNTSPENVYFTLAALPASLPPTLEYLNCRRNRLTSLPPLPGTLKFLDCSFQRVFEDDINTSSTNDLLYEGISLLPPLPAGLEYLNCATNKLTSLPTVLPPGLTYLNCSQNVHVAWGFNVSPGIECLPRLPLTLTALLTDKTLITCAPNSGSYTATPALPLCSPINNVNQCTANPIMSGSFYYDNNSNAVRDAGENLRANVAVQSSFGGYAYSNTNGYFELSGDLGVSSLSVTAPPFYSSVPASASYTFSSYDTTVNQLYALQPQVSVDSISISIVPITAARPGFQHYYQVNYENVGTTVVPANFTLTYDASRMSYDMSSIPGVINSVNVLTVPPIALNPGDRGNFYVYFDVNASAALGDTIHVILRSTANTSISTDSAFSVIRGSFDPNDKRATPVLSTAQVSSGTFINYLVRFQNTGTDTAFTVVVTDVLNTQLDVSSFQMIAASHAANVKRNGSNLSFEFINILLPDVNTNEQASHGYIRFRVKPLTTVPANSIIPNNASIYFDYNSPIITNTANTLIQPNLVPLSLLSFKALNGSGSDVLLFWNTSNETNTATFDVEESSNGTMFTMIGAVAAKGSGDASYSFKTSMRTAIVYYRLKIRDVDGRYTYSPIIVARRSAAAESVVLLANPAKNNLNIVVVNSLLNNTSAKIINAQGMLIKQFILKEGFQSIDISHLPAGVYYLRTNLHTQKFVVN